MPFAGSSTKVCCAKLEGLALKMRWITVSLLLNLLLASSSAQGGSGRGERERVGRSSLTATEAQVRHIFEVDPILTPTSFRISEDGVGVIRLDGQVATLFERELAAEAARSVVGVASVVNHVRVSRALVTPEDERLARSIRRRLRLSPSIESRRIRVVAQGGVVVLSGSVDSRLIQRRVLSRAYGAGAAMVFIRELEIEPAPGATSEAGEPLLGH